MSREIRLRPSAAHRWLSCTAQPALEAAVDPEETESPAAREGTRLHEYMEETLRLGRPPARATAGHREAVEEAVRQYRGTIDAGRGLSPLMKERPIRIEPRLSLGRSLPIEGVADAISWHRPSSTVVVVDWKFGRGVRVDAVENPQLLIYMAGAVRLTHERGLRRPARIEGWIVQPRHPAPGPRSWVLAYDELVERIARMTDTLERIVDGDVRFDPSEENCRWCPVRDDCPQAFTGSLNVAEAARLYDIMSTP